MPLDLPGWAVAAPGIGAEPSAQRSARSRRGWQVIANSDGVLHTCNRVAGSWWTWICKSTLPGRSRHPHRPKRIGGTAVIRLVRAYLNSGIMDDGVVQKRMMGRRRAGRYRHCWPTSCSMKWTRRWNVGAIASCVTPTARTFTFAAAGRVNG